MVFLKEFFEKVNFEKKSADDKKHEKLPKMQRGKTPAMFTTDKDFVLLSSYLQDKEGREKVLVFPVYSLLADSSVENYNPSLELVQPSLYN